MQLSLFDADPEPVYTGSLGKPPVYTSSFGKPPVPTGLPVRLPVPVAAPTPPPDFPGSKRTPIIETATPVAATPVPAAPESPPAYRHPNAHHEVRLGEHLVGYELKRAKRRSIGFTISEEGLRVSAPKWVPVADIQRALQEKHSWILRKLHEQRDRARRLQSAKVDWRDGTSIPYLGEPMVVVLDPRAASAPGGACLSSGEDAAQAGLVSAQTLHVGLPQGATPEQIRDIVQSWLQRQARQFFLGRCQHFAAQLNVRMTRLSLSSAQTRWGSASADGSIRLNWRLIHFAPSTIDYVVAHELAHLREMNHSPRFWDVVRSVVPDYQRLRGSLKSEQAPILD